MTTMYDAPMQDFTGENSMDADMLPSTVQETDWFQSESMMDDGEMAGQMEDEVEMTNDEVQEFEMTDAGDADIYEYQDISSKFAEPQDQELPDASRVASPQPSPQQYQEHDPAPTMTTLNYPDSLGGDTPVATEVISHESTNDTGGGSATHPSPGMRNISIAEGSQLDVTPPKNDVSDVSDVSEVLKSSSHAGVTATEVSNPSQEPAVTHDSIHSPSHQEGNIPSNLAVPEESHTHLEESVSEVEAEVHGKVDVIAETSHGHDNVVSHDAPQSDSENKSKEKLDTGVLHHESLDDNTRNPEPYRHDGDEATQDDDLDSSTDQPPCVLLSFTFDGSRFALFELPADHVLSSANVAPIPSRQATQDHKSQEASNATVVAKNGITLLFESRSDLFYDPVSSLFEALRNDTATNVEGRFDQNIELVLSAPDLDLTLPEDNIYVREVSLHDLTILHTGCDLPGHLTLRLDTNAPRFGTRYKAIRDEVFRVISQQETDDQQDVPSSTAVAVQDEFQEKTVANIAGDTAGPEADQPHVENAEIVAHAKESENEERPEEGNTQHIPDDVGEQEEEGIVPLSPRDYEEEETEQHENDTEYYGDDSADTQQINVEDNLETEEGDAEGIPEGDENYVDVETIYDENENEPELEEEPAGPHGDVTGEYDNAEENNEFADAPLPSTPDLTEHEASAPPLNPQESTQSAPISHKSTPSTTEDSTADLLQRGDDGESSSSKTIGGSSLDNADGGIHPSSSTLRVKKGSKRSFGEHEADQHQQEHTNSDIGDTKRFKVA